MTNTAHSKKSQLNSSTDISKNAAIKFIVLIGIVSLFADMTYEGARSITGPYLAYLGASATVVGSVAGFGEFVGYALRLVSGYLADKTSRYWFITIIGYLLNLLAVPLLALTNHWQSAAVLMITERIGKAIRTPARDAMLSHASEKIGMGWGFGLHEALDQTGAMIGPLVIAVILYFKGSYHQCFAALIVPVLLALIVLSIARCLYPNPHKLNPESANIKPKVVTLPFWIYLAGASLIAAGYADFPLIAYHFQKANVLPTAWIPIAYAFAMGVSGLTAPILGRYYDHFGFVILIIVSIVSSCFAPLVFLGGFKMAFLGVALWSLGIGAQESLMRAIIGNMVSFSKRGSAYGIFNTGYGIFWFLGSVLMGMLYDKSIFALIVFSVSIQFAAIPLFCVVAYKMRLRRN